MLTVDRDFCASIFLMFRSLHNTGKSFSDIYPPRLYDMDFRRTAITNADELDAFFSQEMGKMTAGGDAALMLSGGIDSAVLAKYMPEGSTVYTLKCLVPGVAVADETAEAIRYAKEYGLLHKTIEVYWEDFLAYIPLLMKHKGAPIHSIEVQLYKAALTAHKDGFTKLIFGETADLIYGGLDKLLSKDWLIGDFIERYVHVLPYKVLRQPELILEPFYAYEREGCIDTYRFLNEYFLLESYNSYANACDLGKVEFLAPYAKTYLGVDLDYQKIRAGYSKYIIRDLFKRHYQDFAIPAKLPLPRATKEWLRLWEGPRRREFFPGCTKNMSGDQKWLVFCLEWFLDILDNQNEFRQSYYE